MLDKESVQAQILQAFEANEYPGDWCLRGGNEGDEPYLLEQEFRGKADWRTLDPGFIDRVPAGFGSALSFFSDEAFRFYLPAYLLADIDDKLYQADPLFHLMHGVDDESRDKRINPRRYGDRTWFDAARCKFAMFLRPEAAAIVAYLSYKLQSGELFDDDKRRIEQALQNYWLERTGAGPARV